MQEQLGSEVEKVAANHLKIDADTTALWRFRSSVATRRRPKLQRGLDLMQRSGALDRRIEMAPLIIPPQLPDT